MESLPKYLMRKGQFPPRVLCIVFKNLGKFFIFPIPTNIFEYRDMSK